MELARLHLKLSGDPQNTIFIDNVSPAQLAVYAAMHGEDCVQSLTITKKLKTATRLEPNPEYDPAFDEEEDKFIEIDEMDYLRQTFATENATKILESLFPGLTPRLPVTFRSIGYDPDTLIEEKAVVKMAPKVGQAKSNEAQDAIKKRIKAAAAASKAEDKQTLAEKTKQALPAGVVPAVPLDSTELEDQFDDADDLDLDDDGLDEDLIDQEMGKETTEE